MPAKFVRFNNNYHPYTSVIDHAKERVENQNEIHNDLDNPEPYQGFFGEVYRGDWEGRAVAVKKLKGNKNDELFNREVTIWGELHHQNVVPLLDVESNDLVPNPSTQILTPEYPNGNLNEWIAENPKADHKALLIGITYGMEYLHSNDLIHGDLRGENIYVNDSGQCVLSDFGIAKAFDPPEIGLGSHVASLRWQAPECVLSTSGNDLSPASDVWSFGCVAGQLYSGRIPFERIRNDVGIVLAHHRRRPPFEFGNGATTSGRGRGHDQEIWRLSLYCTQYDRDKRPTAAFILAWLLGAEDTPNSGGRCHSSRARL